VREELPFADGDGIDGGIVGSGTPGDVQKRDGFVEVDGVDRVIFEKLPHVDLGQLDAVAVVVVVGVVAPVGRTHRRDVVALRVVLQIAVVPVDDLGAAVHVRHRRDKQDDLVADALDVRVLGDGEAVGQFHDHLGRPGLGRMEAGGDVHDRLGLGGDLRGLGIGEVARIGKLAGVAFVFIEPGEVGFVADDDEVKRAAFLARARFDELDVRRGVGECLKIAGGVLGTRQLAFGTGDVAEHVARRRHAVMLGDVADHRREIIRARRVDVNLAGAGLVDRVPLGHGSPGRLLARALRWVVLVILVGPPRNRNRQ